MFLQVEQLNIGKFNTGSFDVKPFSHRSMSSTKLSIFYHFPFKLMDKLQRNVIFKPEEYSSRTEYKVEYSSSSVWLSSKGIHKYTTMFEKRPLPLEKFFSFYVYCFV